MATTPEVSGDAAIRLAIYDHSGAARIALLLGAALLFGYGSFLNFGPIEFGRVVFLVFRTLPTLPIAVGGSAA